MILYPFISLCRFSENLGEHPEALGCKEFVPSIIHSWGGEVLKKQRVVQQHSWSPAPKNKGFLLSCHHYHLPIFDFHSPPQTLFVLSIIAQDNRRRNFYLHFLGWRLEVGNPCLQSYITSPAASFHSFPISLIKIANKQKHDVVPLLVKGI